jgi:hypothetical protein
MQVKEGNAARMPSLESVCVAERSISVVALAGPASRWFASRWIGGDAGGEICVIALEMWALQDPGLTLAGLQG